MNNKQASIPITRARILAVVLIYAIFGACWILLSDQVVQLLFKNPEQIFLVSTLKGWFYVALTSLMLYGLMRRWLHVEPTTPMLPHARLLLPFGLLAIAVVVIAMSGVFFTLKQHTAEEAEHLKIIADLKVRQIGNWLAERHADAEFIKTSLFFAEHYQRWQIQHEAEAGQALLARLQQFAEGQHIDAVTLLNPQAQIVWHSDAKIPNLTPALQEIATQTARDQQIRYADLYLDQQGQTQLDFAVPLALPAPAPVVLLHLGLQQQLFDLLLAWPIHSQSGEIILLRRAQDEIVYFNDQKKQADTKVQLRLPISTPKLLAAQVLKGAVPEGSLIEGVDYRNQPSIGVMSAIKGTDWYLLAKQDKHELYAKAKETLGWIGFASILALFMTGVSYFLVRQNQQLLLENEVQAIQSERLRALKLLAAIADSSNDAIFAKDLQGRYILFNRAACAFVGKQLEEVLGNDDSVLFPPQEAAMLASIGKRVAQGNQIVTAVEVLATQLGPRTFLATKGPLRDEAGKVIGIYGISRDITDRERAEAALRASEKTYRLLFENMLNSVVHARIIFQEQKPIDLEYLAANPAFATVTGIKQNVVGQRISAVIPGYCERHQESLEIFGRVALTGESTFWEHYLPELARWFSFMIYSPNAGEVIIVTENITERKQSEISLRTSEERLQLALNVSSDGLWDWDLSRGVFYFTPRYYEITGYAATEVTPDIRFFESTLHPEDKERVLANIDDNLQGVLPLLEVDYRLIKASAEVIWVHCKGKVVQHDAAGKPLRMLGTLTDINTAKQAEEALRRQTLELGQRNQELERFNRATIGRELDMIALKQQVNALALQLGQAAPYDLAFVSSSAPAVGDTPRA